MQDYQYQFIEFAIAHNVLCFGEFTLKSGRVSPYFFNSGLFNDGDSLWQLGKFYARAIHDSDQDFDMLFGPAYKGIPLVSSVAIAFHQEYKRTITYCFNRKEEKNHGEGGLTIGAPLTGKVLIVDDVISAGTSVNLSVEIIHKSGAKPAGVAIALNRQEQGQEKLSAIEEVELRHGMKVISIITLENLIEYLQQQSGKDNHLQKIIQYRQLYGST